MVSVAEGSPLDLLRPGHGDIPVELHTLTCATGVALTSQSTREEIVCLSNELASDDSVRIKDVCRVDGNALLRADMDRAGYLICRVLPNVGARPLVVAVSAHHPMVSARTVLSGGALAGIAFRVAGGGATCAPMLYDPELPPVLLLTSLDVIVPYPKDLT